MESQTTENYDAINSFISGVIGVLLAFITAYAIVKYPIIVILTMFIIFLCISYIFFYIKAAIGDLFSKNKKNVDRPSTS